MTLLDKVLTHEKAGIEGSISVIVNDFCEANHIEDWQDLCYGEDYDGATSDYMIAAGATKVVLIPMDASFVIKIPFFGEKDWDWDNDPIPYMGAYAPGLEDVEPNNYCELEAELYKEAVKWELEDFFVPTVFFGDVCGLPIYVQPRIHNIKRLAAKDSAYKYASIKGSEEFDTDVGANLVEFYNLNDVERLLQFFKHYKINDVDNFRNSGYDTICGRYVFWDYAGFKDY